MPKYYFKARNNKNELIEGARTASSEQEALKSLGESGLVVFSIEDSGEKFSKAEKSSGGFSFGGSVSYKDISIFCRQFSTLINAGVTIIEAIEDCAEMSVNVKLSGMLRGMSAEIRAGSTLSDSLKKYENIFGRVFIVLIAVGERSGKLGKILKDLAEFMEDSVKLKRKVQAASAYPLFVIGFFGVALVAIVFFLIPKFKAMFASFGAQLPLPTLIVMNISEIAIKNFPFVFVGAVVAITAAVMFYKTLAGRTFFDTLLLKLPVAGPIFKKIVFARFFQTLATLIRSGNDVVNSLEIAAGAADNLYISDKILKVKNSVIEGATISEEMERQKVFPKMVCRMTAVGEKAGQLDEMFEKLSEYYSDEVDAVVDSLSSIIEPVLIIGIGLIIGVVVVALYLPIFKIGMAMH
jgi:type IV pilus assembly protein PilC